MKLICHKPDESAWNCVPGACLIDVKLVGVGIMLHELCFCLNCECPRILKSHWMILVV